MLHSGGRLFQMIDLRSDTLTQPSGGMRRAMAEAVVGDEQKREDPTVIELEERVADLLGHDAAVFLPTATMGNHIALRLLTEQSEAQGRAVDSAGRTTSLSSTRYRAGYVSQLELLDAQRSELRNRRQALEVRSERYQSTVALVRALGGSWE